MSRSDEDKLRACPTCGGKVKKDLGLRDYSRWLFDVLPGRAAATDLDCIIEQHSTGRVLVFEFKPSRYVPRGQALLFDTLVASGWDVLLVVDTRIQKDELDVSLWGHPTWKTMSLSELKQMVADWWAYGLPNEATSSDAHPLAALLLPATEVRQVRARVGRMLR